MMTNNTEYRMSDASKRREAWRFQNWIASIICGLINGLLIFLFGHFVIPSVAWKPEQLPTVNDQIFFPVGSAILGTLIIRFCLWLQYEEGE
jgi:hypothetical protein